MAKCRYGGHSVTYRRIGVTVCSYPSGHSETSKFLQVLGDEHWARKVLLHLVDPSRVIVVGFRWVNTTVFTPARVAILPTSSVLRWPSAICRLIRTCSSGVMTCHCPDRTKSCIRCSIEFASETSR